MRCSQPSSQLKDVPLLTGTMTMDPETQAPDKEITLVQMSDTEPTLLEKLHPELHRASAG